MKGHRKLVALGFVGFLELLTLAAAYHLALRGMLTADFATVASVVAGGAAAGMLGFAGGNATEYLGRGGQ